MGDSSQTSQNSISTKEYLQNIEFDILNTTTNAIDESDKTKFTAWKKKTINFFYEFYEDKIKWRNLTEFQKKIKDIKNEIKDSESYLSSGESANNFINTLSQEIRTIESLELLRKKNFFIEELESKLKVEVASVLNHFILFSDRKFRLQDYQDKYVLSTGVLTRDKFKEKMDIYKIFFEYQLSFEKCNQFYDFYNDRYLFPNPEDAIVILNISDLKSYPQVAFEKEYKLIILLNDLESKENELLTAHKKKVNPLKKVKTKSEGLVASYKNELQNLSYGRSPSVHSSPLFLAPSPSRDTQAQTIVPSTEFFIEFYETDVEKTDNKITALKDKLQTDLEGLKDVGTQRFQTKTILFKASSQFGRVNPPTNFKNLFFPSKTELYVFYDSYDLGEDWIPVEMINSLSEQVMQLYLFQDILLYEIKNNSIKINNNTKTKIEFIAKVPLLTKYIEHLKKFADSGTIENKIRKLRIEPSSSPDDKYKLIELELLLLAKINVQTKFVGPMNKIIIDETSLIEALKPFKDEPIYQCLIDIGLKPYRNENEKTCRNLLSIIKKIDVISSNSDKMTTKSSELEREKDKINNRIENLEKTHENRFGKKLDKEQFKKELQRLEKERDDISEDFRWRESDIEKTLDYQFKYFRQNVSDLEDSIDANKLKIKELVYDTGNELINRIKKIEEREEKITEILAFLIPFVIVPIVFLLLIIFIQKFIQFFKTKKNITKKRK